MMWVRMSCLVALSTVAGCESIAVSPALFGGADSGFGYAQAPLMPRVPEAAGAVAPAAASAAPIAPTAPGARAVILPVVPDPVEVANLPVYDHRKDPYVTSVLMAPVSTSTLSEVGGPRTEDGRPILPPFRAPSVIEIGSVRSGLAASAAQD